MIKIIIQDISIDINCVSKNILNTSRFNLFYLQKKIYQASKECNLSLVKSLQKLLVSLYSVKILASIIANNKSSNNKIVLQHIKDQIFNEFNHNLFIKITKPIVLWCLNPEWQPKMYFCRMDQKFCIPKLNKKYVNYIYSSRDKISLKYIDEIYTLSKLQSINWIEEAINTYLKNKFFIQHLNYSLGNQIQCDELLDLINLITLNKLKWVLFRQTKTVIKKLTYSISFFVSLQKLLYCCTTQSQKLSIDKIFSNFAKDLNVTNKYFKNHNSWIVKKNYYNTKVIDFSLYLLDLDNNIYQEQYKQLFSSIYDFLFHKDSIGRRRINTYLSRDMIYHRFNDLIYNIQINCFLDHEYDKVTSLNRRLNKIIYTWMKKKV